MLNLLSSDERHEIIDYCHNRYGIDPAVWNRVILKRSAEAVWASPLELESFLKGQALEEAETSGLRIFSGKSFPYKITHSFLTLFSEDITDGTIELEGAQVRGLLFDKVIGFGKSHKKNEGYVILKYRGFFLGVGLKRGAKIESQIPKKLVNQLSEKLEFRDE